MISNPAWPWLCVKSGKSFLVQRCTGDYDVLIFKKYRDAKAEAHRLNIVDYGIKLSKKYKII